MNVPPELVQLFGGSSGAIALIYFSIEFYKARKKSHQMDEDTAISRLEEDYKRKKAEAEKGWRLVQWFRYQYPLLWSAYMQMPDAEKDKYPPTPPTEIDN